MENIHQLPLVLVETLNLHIENGIRIHLNAIVLLDILCQPQLILVLNVHELFLGLFVVCQSLDAGNLGQIRNPAVPHFGGNPGRKQRIAVEQETPLGDAVGLVVKAVREHLVEVPQLLLL